MSNLAIYYKVVNGYMEYCEEELNDLRKEKIEVNRMKKKLYVIIVFMFFFCL